ncbi:hypothetical protein TPHA_0H01420 [Tetrapisispora phaffii CBS 4417]|uniref:Kinetochore protein NDC80 n=1 Tax=Tetrapisispora phaffii (strain ATCC 24235 / CBS 4417 / NBRC 1672 / NRRL Y-8282 / UCD 70-5) TaxID=1071381 RepID=G8BX44_TETPH|nr:hypothetical protein TPHA_0H01420 [Tetrapisispora phaffii CBS 4417]CCE64348.1 hypothetical protein TPHA_0H01420 [Tetrapisispora phaffii CBS 4417]
MQNIQQPILNNLNPQLFTSQIPAPSTGIKRRQSVSNVALTDMINSSIAKNAHSNKSDPNNRKKLRSTVSSVNQLYNQKRTSYIRDNEPSGMQRHSMLPYPTNNNNDNNNNDLNTNNVSTRDPRPLRDKNFQNAMQQDIINYLTSNKFEIETNLPITNKTLKQPTQKGFIITFQWLYQRLDPGYQFKSNNSNNVNSNTNKSVELEIYQILKFLQYPYLDTINKSQISAVGGNSWHKFLGMLHWMVKTNISLDKSLKILDKSLIDENTQDLKSINEQNKLPLTQEEQDSKQDKYEVLIEQICINYIIECYKKYLKNDDNFEPILKDLNEEFKKFNHIFDIDLNSLRSKTEALSVECDGLVKIYENLKLSRDKNIALKSDLSKFQNYVDGMKNKSNEWSQKLEKMNNEKALREDDIRDISEEISSIKKFLKDKNISIDVISNKNLEFEKLSKDLDQKKDEVNKFVSSTQSLKIEFESIMKALNDTLRQYDLSTETLINERISLGHSTIKKSDFELLIDDSIKQNYNSYLNNGKAIDFNKMFKNDLNTMKIKNNIIKLNNEIQERIEGVEKNNSVLEQKLISLKQEVMDKNKMTENVELKLSEANSTYELNKQESDNKLLKQKIEIEKLERKINDANKILKEKLLETQQLINSTRLKKEELQLQLDREKNNISKKILEIIDFSGNIMERIQNKLESSQSIINKELEN